MDKIELANILETINDKALQYALNEAEDQDDGEEVCSLQTDFFFEDFSEWFISISPTSNFVVELLVEDEELRNRFKELTDGYDLDDLFGEYLTEEEWDLF